MLELLLITNLFPITDLCGTPGYLAPETLKCNMFDDAPGYSREVDMYVLWYCSLKLRPKRIFNFLQMGLWRDYVHTSCRLSSILASQTNDYAAQYHGGKI